MKIEISLDINIKNIKGAFTLVELMVATAIIGILAGLSLKAVQKARSFAAEEKTKATIAKLDAIIMRKVESYGKRRVPVNLQPGTPPGAAAWMRLDALRDLMRMEMPDSAADVANGPQRLQVWDIASKNKYRAETPQEALKREPAVHKIFVLKPPDTSLAPKEYASAQCLYMIVGSEPEALSQFDENEIGTVGPPSNPKKIFIDGWGNPISFIRWAPSYVSDIQTGDSERDHDPFDVRNVQPAAFKLIPLIFSPGPDGITGLQIRYPFPSPDPTENSHINPYKYYPNQLGAPIPGKIDHRDNITNHQIEMN